MILTNFVGNQMIIMWIGICACEYNVTCLLYVQTTWSSSSMMMFTNHMMTSSNGSIYRVTGVRGIHCSSVNSPHNGQWREALIFCLICVWMNGWVNNGKAGDLRRYRAHYNVIVMMWCYDIQSASNNEFMWFVAVIFSGNNGLKWLVCLILLPRV